ncbi:MAG: hypothetical protein RLN88_09530 [Ekhidna sp.]|uniref:hypothetical protein n=1 Tax=Ekhidna sp. TaxID=2608089 RepID=UPI0032EF7193
MEDVFLSRPNWIAPIYSKGAQNFYNALESLELNPRTIGQSDYPLESPLDEVISLMEKCSGTIILGIPQMEVKGKVKNKEVKNLFQLGTEWNHIEAGIAYSIGHPLLIIHHERVTRGIFDRGASKSFLYKVDMKDSSWPIQTNITGALINWKSKLKQPKVKKIESDNKVDKPNIKWGMYEFENEQGFYCPRCYQKEGIKMPLSRSNFGLYSCPNCQAKFSEN